MTPEFPGNPSTDAPLGCQLSAGGATFRLFAPRATSVTLELFPKFLDRVGERLAMAPGPGGTWELTVERALVGTWYAYRIDGPSGPPGPHDTKEMFDPSVLVADPYSKAVTTVNHWRLPAKTLILDETYDWGGDRRPTPRDQSELVIYECHVRDLTAHPSAGARRPGTYAGLAEKGIAGGMDHILSLGVNAVELLPVMKFGTHELPYREDSARTDTGRMNDWNPYARNHWGYMTSFFFAPETYYGTDGSAEPAAVNGRDGRAGRELRDLVRAFHREGIAVILDVVYNHTSHYDFNPFKYIDKEYYYRCDANGAFLEASGCGNDFHTERPMARRAIVDSVMHWMTEYHVDGFRFDLAGMIDEETIRAVTEAARAINPNVVLIAEPWGGGRHHPAWFRELGWCSWNDRYRDGVKGRDPHQGLGLLFGTTGTTDDRRALLAGRLPGDGSGNGLPEGRSVNYIESHDGYTLGDFIRIAAGEVPADGRVRPDGGPPYDARLTTRQLVLNRFAAFALLTSPGPVMLHEGQEFARAKVIAGPAAVDPDAGRLDHNSYNKDDATNYLDFTVRDANRGLFDYYRGLIRLRERHPALCRPRDPASVEVRGNDGLLCLISLAPLSEVSPTAAKGTFNRYIIVLNASPDRTETVPLPSGRWTLLADGSAVHPDGDGPVFAGEAAVPPSSGAVFGERSSLH